MITSCFRPFRRIANNSSKAVTASLPFAQTLRRALNASSMAASRTRPHCGQRPLVPSRPSASPPEGRTRLPPCSLDNHKDLGENHAPRRARTCTNILARRARLPHHRQKAKHAAFRAISISRKRSGRRNRIQHGQLKSAATKTSAANGLRNGYGRIAN